jgi:hypothetical protein
MALRCLLRFLVALSSVRDLLLCAKHLLFEPWWRGQPRGHPTTNSDRLACFDGRTITRTWIERDSIKSRRETRIREHERQPLVGFALVRGGLDFRALSQTALCTPIGGQHQSGVLKIWLAYGQCHRTATLHTRRTAQAIAKRQTNNILRHGHSFP